MSIKAADSRENFQELKEDVARFLISVDMRAPKNRVEYSFKDGGFVSVQSSPPTVTLLHFESCIILRDSPEGQKQIAAGDWDGNTARIIDPIGCNRQTKEVILECSV